MTVIKLESKNTMEKRVLDLVDKKDPITVYEDDPVYKGLELLKEKNIGALLVVSSQGKLIGILTERDIIKKVDFTDKVWSKRRVSCYMSEFPFYIKEDGLICDLVNNLSVGNYRHMPIVDENEVPVGLVSIKDLIPLILESYDSEIEMEEEDLSLAA